MEVYAKQKHDTALFYTSSCDTPTSTPLVQGRNEAGFNCVPADYSAYEFLQDVGEANVVSIQRFNTVNGAFETASFMNGTPVGGDFPIVEGEGYIVFMKKNHVWSAP